MTKAKRLLITDRLSQAAFLLLQEQDFFQIEKTPAPEITVEQIKGVNVLLIRSRTPIDEKLLSDARQLQLIVTATSGFDHIDLKACEKWGITVMNTPSANVNTAAQLTWSLVLACAHHLVKAHAQVKAGFWNRDLLIGQELEGKVYGVVGLGRIGSRVAEIAEAFGMQVIAYDPYADDERFRSRQAERVSYEELLKRADVISFHVPLTKETSGMLSSSQLEYIQRGVILVNTSRGAVIVEQDLCQALEKGWVGSCGLDVFEKEPLSRSSSLLRLQNVLFTPHVGANSLEAFHKASEQAASKIISFFRDGTTSDTLPPKAAWYGL
ncbi:MAG: phosphoglycerate dehydrogenase [Bdellovibrio sp.]|nr:MAG: phosphoglycerate dehydrogenase [Bdellovibrio sp.]